MSSVGNWLRAARESRGLSFQDVESVTRIRARYLEALETGNTAILSGGEPQVRGFLRRYADFLGLSPDEAIARHEQKAYVAQPEAAPVAAPAPKPAPGPSSQAAAASAPTPRPASAAAPKTAPAIKPPPARKAIPRSVIWRVAQVVGVVGLIVLLVLGGVWLVTRPDREEGPQATTTPGAAAVTPTTGPTELVPLGATSAPPAPPSTPTFAVAPGGGVTLTLEAVEHVWVRVTADGVAAFTGMLTPGAPQTWSGTQTVVVETGNGAGVVAVVNGQSFGPLGGRGEVLTRAWGPTGEIEAPPTP